MKPIIKVSVLSLACLLSACSTLETDKVDYRSTGKAPSLNVPPDLTQLSNDTRYAITGGAVSASSYQAGQKATSKTPIAALSLTDVRIERAGNQRWLVVKRPAETLWEPVKDFWQENGFLLAMDQSSLGIMETEWAENRAKIPQDIIRAALGKLLDSLYSTPERDKFRTRLERNADGSTEIFITHRGMQEVYTNDKSTVWQPRATDPELEAEFLRRLMVKLGTTPEEAKAAVASSVAQPIANTTTLKGQPAVLINEPFDRAWRRVGLVLDRTGFTVEDRDRKQGIYFVRYVPANPNTAEPGFLGKLFGGGNKAAEASKFQIAVKSNTNTSHVLVFNAKGEVETTDVAQRIVKVIADDMQ